MAQQPGIGADLHELGETAALALYTTFLEHPHEQNMGYFAHAGRALALSLRSGLASFAFAVHALLPGCFRTRGSSTIKMLAARICEDEARLMARNIQWRALVVDQRAEPSEDGEEETKADDEDRREQDRRRAEHTLTALSDACVAAHKN